MGVVLAISSALMFSLNNIMIKKGIAKSNNERSDNGLLITVLMNVIILGVILMIVWEIKGEALYFSKEGVLFFMVAGVCTSGIGRMTLFASISYIGPSKASAIRNTTPIFTAIFALLFLGEVISFWPGIGMMLILWAILFEGYRSFHYDRHAGLRHEGNSSYGLGFGLALISAFIFGVGQGFRKLGLLETDDAFLGAWIGSITSLLFVIILQSRRQSVKTVIDQSIRIFNRYYVIAGVLTSLGPLSFFLAVQYMQVSYVSVIAATEPLLTVFISALFLKGQEKMTVQTWLTIALIISGAVFIVLFG
ncbi:DMT family transporter [Lentibacillus saliphilus]|uniref:DMT family transporter n=1 Tax=Lentibacillus saliphilus TaxID=2737028 RepID=UPI001C308070|nr:EamA family transporter [Lentibacillus saliphilus]